MFDKLFEFITNIWEKITFFIIVREYQKGAWLRVGRLRKVVGKGIYLKWPYFDEIELHHVLTTSMELDPQSITTKDERDIVVKAVIKYKISDLSKFYTDVYDAVDAIKGVSMGIIRNVISKKTWNECKEESLDNDITKKVKIEARKWGLEVESVTLSDLSKMKSIRLLNFNKEKVEQ